MTTNQSMVLNCIINVKDVTTQSKQWTEIRGTFLNTEKSALRFAKLRFYNKDSQVLNELISKDSKRHYAQITLRNFKRRPFNNRDGIELFEMLFYVSNIEYFDAPNGDHEKIESLLNSHQAQQLNSFLN